VAIKDSTKNLMNYMKFQLLQLIYDVSVNLSTYEIFIKIFLKNDDHCRRSNNVNDDQPSLKLIIIILRNNFKIQKAILTHNLYIICNLCYTYA